jgi:diguanylate cyclase (GGDEF)-like protein
VKSAVAARAFRWPYGRRSVARALAAARRTGRRPAAAALEADIVRLREELGRALELHDQLRHQALHDPLTNLANRALFTDRAEHALSARDSTRRVAILFVDLDDFKSVNDAFGHLAGDTLLVAAAERLRSCVRPEDTVARHGGDEFVVLVDDARQPAEVTGIAERIVAEMNRWFEAPGTELVINASVGVAFGIPGKDAADDVLQRADAAMYRAKAGGKNRFEVFGAPAMVGPAGDP